MRHPTQHVRLRVPRFALASWPTLRGYVEKRVGAPVVAKRLFLARADWEALRAVEFNKDPEATRLQFRQGIGPYVAPLLRRGLAIYEQSKGQVK